MKYRQVQEGQLLRFFDDQAQAFACCVSMRLVEQRHEKREVLVVFRAQRRRSLARVTPAMPAEPAWRKAA